MRAFGLILVTGIGSCPRNQELYVLTEDVDVVGLHAKLLFRSTRVVGLRLLHRRVERGVGPEDVAVHHPRGAQVVPYDRVEGVDLGSNFECITRALIVLLMEACESQSVDKARLARGKLVSQSSSLEK